MIICGRLDDSFENLLIVVLSRLKDNIDCGWVMISCHSLLSPLGLNYQSRRTVRTSNSKGMKIISNLFLYTKHVDGGYNTCHQLNLAMEHPYVAIKV